MPKPPLPPQLDEFLKQPNPSVIGSLRPDGSPHTAATWYLWEDGKVLVNMEDSRKRLEHLRHDPRVSITVLDKDLWYRHVTLSGRATLKDDPRLEDIDRLCRHYMGDAYSNREDPRISAWIDVDSWHSWEFGKPWTGD